MYPSWRGGRYLSYYFSVRQGQEPVSVREKKAVLLRQEDSGIWRVLVRPLDSIAVPADYIFVDKPESMPPEEKARLLEYFSMVPAHGDDAERRLMDLEQLADFLLRAF